MEWTCIECGFRYDETCGDIDERTCSDCLEEELTVDDGGNDGKS